MEPGRKTAPGFLHGALAMAGMMIAIFGGRDFGAPCLFAPVSFGRNPYGARFFADFPCHAPPFTGIYRHVCALCGLAPAIHTFDLPRD
jgi:hypothetical protein